MKRRPKLNNDEFSEIRWGSVGEMAKLSPIFAEDLGIFRKFEAKRKMKNRE